jgi:hypothetical protein
MSPTTASCIIIIRATQKNRMSCPVTSTEVGKYFCSSGVGSGQPSVPIGQRPEENQVSRTSGSRQTG